MSWLRYLVPAVAVMAMIGISGVLGAALWRTHRELGLVQTAVEDEQSQIEELRRDLVEAKAEARRAQVENARLSELASNREIACPDPDVDVGMDMGLRRNKPTEKSKARSRMRVGCEPNDPLCGL